MPSISVENAVIKTASVEIKTLTISGRQVTLSVFRQIQEEDIFNEDLSLKGVPWGTINYFWKVDWTEMKIHLLWQNGKELRRCVLYKKSTSNDNYGNRDFLIDHIRKISADIRMLREDINWMHKKEYSYHNVSKEDRATNFHYIQSCIDKVEGRAYGTDHDFKTLEECNSALSDLHETEQENKEMIENKINERNSMCKKYDVILETFMELPHLFIAV